MGCEYGKECCCGKCYASEVYMCTGDRWISYFTDACMMPECQMPIPVPADPMDAVKCCKKDFPQGWDEGGICCSDGDWHADVGDGSTTCEEFGLEDSARCPSDQCDICAVELKPLTGCQCLIELDLYGCLDTIVNDNEELLNNLCFGCSNIQQEL